MDDPRFIVANKQPVVREYVQYWIAGRYNPTTPQRVVTSNPRHALDLAPEGATSFFFTKVLSVTCVDLSKPDSDPKRYIVAPDTEPVETSGIHYIDGRVFTKQELKRHKNGLMHSMLVRLQAEGTDKAVMSRDGCWHIYGDNDATIPS